MIILHSTNTNIGNTNIAFTEDVVKRFEGYCWHTQFIEDGDNDFAGICKAVENAINVKDKPSLIKIRTTIGIGSKDQGTGKVHGSPLSPDDIIEIKKKFNFDPNKFFYIPDEVII